MTKDEALKMAIEAMNSAYSSHGKILTSNPAQDAWLYHGCDAKLFKALQACKEALEQSAPSWQGLSEEEIDKLYADWERGSWDYINFADAIEQALKEKNT